MAPRVETFTEALKRFLLHIRKYKRGSKAQINKRYCISGSVGHFSKYAGDSNNLPLFHWVEPCPEQYQNIDMKMAIKDYLQPYVYVPIEPKKNKSVRIVNVMTKKAPMEYGNISHQTDIDHYKKLSMKLQAKGLFR